MVALAAPGRAQLRSAFPNAGPVPVYSPTERAVALKQLLHQAKPPALGAAVSVTPNAPYAPDGTHLDLWKTSFVLGTASGGEAGVNFWGMHIGGHMNVGFKPGAAKSYALDCRMFSAGAINFKVFTGKNSEPDPHGESTLIDNHLLLVVPTPAAGETVLVELWPTSDTAPMGFLGCDLSPIVN
jgi:hypothetical protein